MDIFKNNWDSPLEYVVTLFNIFCNRNIILKKLNHIQYLQLFLKNNTNVLINEILFNLFISISLTNFFLNPKTHMEYCRLIVEFNVTQYILIGHFMKIIFINYWRFFQI
jgi:hypothetical protein